MTFLPRARVPAFTGGGRGFAKAQSGDVYYEDKGHGVPILLIHPVGATASTWGPVAGELAHLGGVVAYGRQGYSRSPAEPVHSIPRHTADAAALLGSLHAWPTVVAGTSADATIAIDLALRRPGLVRTVVAYESPWRAFRRRPPPPASPRWEDGVAGTAEPPR